MKAIKTILLITLLIGGTLLYMTSNWNSETEEATRLAYDEPNQQIRQTEKAYNPSPYSAFGDDSYVLMTEKERTGNHILEIPVSESADFDNLSKLSLNMKTGKVKVYDKEGTVLKELVLPSDAMSRFLSVDPLAEDYHSISPYVYVLNNPLLLIDPDGRSPDNFYRNEEGDLVAIERTNATTDNFYTIDNNNNVTLDVSRNNQVEGFDRLNDKQKNRVVNHVAETNAPPKPAEYQVNNNGLTKEQSETAAVNAPSNRVVSGLSQNNGVTIATGSTAPNQLLGVYSNGVNTIVVTQNMVVNPSSRGLAQAGAGIVPNGTLPTPTSGQVLPLPANSLPPNQTTVKGGFDGAFVTVPLTDNFGNLVPIQK